MSTFDSHWGTDSPVSMPQPSVDPDVQTVDLGGFVFTPHGIAVDISATERSDAVSMPFRPDVDDG